MSAARTERLLNLLTLLLNSRRPVSLREIRELDEFGAYRTEDPKSGERAFERDKAALIELGVPLRWVSPEQMDDDEEGIGGYQVDRQRYFLPELQLTPGELALLSIAGSAAVALDAFPHKAALIRALAKLGFDVDEACEAPGLAHAPLQAGVDAARVGRHLAVLHDAVAVQRRVQLVYRGTGQSTGGRGATDPNLAPTDRTVDPYGLYYRQGLWYLVGYCRLRGAERTFNLSRVETVRAQGPAQAFGVPGTFDLRAHLDKRPWEFPAGPPQRVTIRLADRLRAAVPEMFGAHVEVEESSSGPLVHLQVSHEAALIAAVMPYGDAAEVLAPAALRAKIGAMFDVLAARYATASLP